MLAACASQPKPTKPAAPPAEMLPAPPPLSADAAQEPQIAATPGLSPEQRFDRALTLLSEGQAPEARAEIAAFLEDRPGDTRGQSLLDQIDKDPKELLGSESFAYTPRRGETLTTLAERFLGDRLKFYALARYNGIAAPSRMEPGRTLQIPGAPPTLQPRRPVRPPMYVPPPRISAPRPILRPAPTPVPVPQAPRGDPQQAARLRQSALGQMQAGSIDSAVRTLERASQLDPGSAPIRADLERARRIRETVRKR